MRFTIDKDQFLKGLLIAGHSIGNKESESDVSLLQA
jgi:hypothetical protein